MKNYLKRSLSMLLAMIMILSPFSGVTVSAHAEDLVAEEVVTTATELVEATIAATELSEAPAEPTAEVTEPATEVIEPTTQVTEPTIEVTEPATEAVEPTAEMTEPVVEETTSGTEDVVYTDGITEGVEAATSTAEEESEAVPYAQYSYNTGIRGETCTELSTAAEAFYTGNYTYEKLSMLSGAASRDDVPASELYEALQTLMESRHTHETSYGETRYQYQYTDCQDGGNWENGKISSFYSGAAIGPAWDGGGTWNREHTWPNSKGLGGNDENDIMMLRPTSKSENSSRGNKAYGKSSGYYNPNSESGGAYDVRGDVARIFLYIYVRWGNVNGNDEYATWGTTGVMESEAVMLEWMEADPVDTWELGRNDVVQEITGTRNVFVDYPELAFLLFDEELPTSMTTPSGEAALSGITYAITATANDASMGTVSLSGKSIQAVPAEGYKVTGYEVISGSATVAQSGNTFTVKASSDCTIQINFAPRARATVTFMDNGQVMDTATAYVDDGIILPDYTGNLLPDYEFAGWAYETANHTDRKPDYAETGNSYTVTGDATFYALFFYTSEDDGETIYYSTCKHEDIESIAGQDATCTIDGYTASVYCNDCETRISGYVTIPAPGHNYVDSVCTACGHENLITSGTCGENLTWRLNDAGRLTISGTGEMTTSPWSDSYCEVIKSVVIEDGVTNIVQAAFNWCSKLTDVSIGKHVTSIGRAAFSGCSELASIELPNGLVSIGDSAFFGCGLTSIDIPESVTTIERCAFLCCYKLKNVKIPASVTTIGGAPFARCASLEGIWVDANNTEYCSDDSGVLYTKDMKTVVQAPGAISGTYKISAGVVSVGESAFSQCKELSGIEIPDGVTDIGRGAFSWCSSLSGIDIPDSVTNIGYAAFQDCGLENIVIPDSVKQIDDYAFCQCSSLKSIKFEGSLPAMESNIFSDTTTTANYPAENESWTVDVLQNYGGNITWISYGKIIARGTCGENLTWKLSEEGLLTISGTGEMPDYTGWFNDDYAPWYDVRNSIKSVVIKQGVTSIGDWAFQDCRNLISIDIPDGVTKIGHIAFSDCSNLSAITIPDSVTVIGSQAFTGCINLVSVTIPEGVTNIHEFVFSNCIKLENIYIPSSVTHIQPGIGNNCQSLKGIWVSPDNSKYCSDDAGVLYTKDMETLMQAPGMLNGNYTIPNSVRSIKSNAFFGCKNLKSVELPDGLFSVGATAFSDCSSLTQINIPGSLERIAVGMFSNCNNLKEIIFEGDAPEFVENDYGPNNAFQNVTATVYYPAKNPTWTSDVMQNYGGTITWKTYCEHDELPNPVVAAESNPATGGGVLTWEDDGEADYYEIYRATSKGGKFKSYKTVTEAYAEVDVKVGKTYYYKVKAICEADASHNSGYSNVVKATGKCAQPEVTVEVKASTGKPVVKWSKVSGAEEYEIYRSTNATEGFKKIKTTSKTSYTDSKAVLGTIYYYKVKAIASKSKYDSAESAAKPCLTILAQPDAELSINKTTGKPVLAWEEVKGATGYEILRAEFEKGEYAKLEEYQGGLTFTDSTAEPDQDYWYKVNSIGASVELNSIDGDAEMIHATLAQLEVTFGINSITGKPVMTWDEVDGAVEYKIYRSSKSKESYKCIETTTELSYSDDSVKAGKAYYYKVIAIGENCKSAYSSYKKLTAKCAQPEITVETGATGKPYVDWNKVKGAEKYYVYRATAEDGEYEKIKSTTKTAYTDSKAKVGTTYYYKVKAVASKSSYNSVYSEVESCLTILAQPEVELTTNKTTGKPVLAWEEVKSAVSYQVYRSENGGEFERVFSTTELTYMDETAIIDSQYAYKVEAIAENTKLNNESAEVSIICACAKPKISVELSSKKPSISWESIEGATKYEIYRSTKKSSGFKKIATVELEDGETYRDSKAKKGTTYYYKVVAVSENAKSAYSNTVKIKSK